MEKSGGKKSVSLEVKNWESTINVEQTKTSEAS